MVVVEEAPSAPSLEGEVLWATTKCVDIVRTFSIGLEFASTDGQSDYKWSDLIIAPMLEPELH